MKIPFWNRISERSKQFLAIVAVLQAIVFCISIPYGIYNEWNFRKWMVEQPSYTPGDAAYLEIVNELYTNSRSRFYAGYGYKEECEEHPPAYLAGDICSELDKIETIVNKWVVQFKLSSDERNILTSELSILANINVE